MDRRRYQTAGFPSTIHLADIPSDVTYEFVTLKAEDGGISRGTPGGRERALKIITDWLKERFPV